MTQDQYIANLLTQSCVASIKADVAKQRYDDAHWGGDPIPKCDYCGLQINHVPDLTISADKRCNICEPEWRALEAQGWTGRKLHAMWFSKDRMIARRVDRKARIATAWAAKQCKEIAA